MPQGKAEQDLKTPMMYWSATGNTEKVAQAIQQELRREGINPVGRQSAKRLKKNYINMT